MKTPAGEDAQGGSAALREPGDFLCRIIDQAAIGMVLLGQDGRWRYANPAFQSLTQYGWEECVGWAVDDLLHPEERETVRDRFAALQSDGANAYRAEHRCIRKDGSTLRGLLTLSALQEVAADSPFRYLLQIIDIGVQQQVDADLKEAEWRWNQALQGSQQVVWDFYVPSSMVWVSPQWKEMLDLPTDERVHHIADWLGKMHPDDRERLAEATERVRISGNPDFDSVYRLRHSDGHWIWVLSRGRVVEYAPDGSIRRMIGTIVDISRQKEMESQITTVNERLQVALEASGAGIFDVNLVTGLCVWDERMHALYNVPVGKFDGTREMWLGFIHPDDLSRVLREYETKESSVALTVEIDFRIRPAGTTSVRHVRSLTKVFRDGQGTPVRLVGKHWDVTEQVEQTKQWRDTLTLLEAVMSGTPDLIFAKDHNGRYLLANRSVEKLMGRSGAEIVGRHDTEIFPHEISKPLIENDRRVIQSGEPYTIEEVAVMDGVLRTYSSTKAPRRNERGEIIGTIGISRDVTDVKAAQAALRQSELRWQFALDGSGDGIWDWDTRTGYVFYSRQWKAMLGYEEDEIGSTVSEWSERVHPDDLPRCWTIINDHFDRGTPDFTLEHRMRAKDGTWRWIYDRGKAIERAEDGRPLRVIGTHTDITVLKEGESAIFEEKERLRITLHSIGDSVITTDAHARITFMNPVAERMTGWSAAEVIGRPLPEVFRLVDDAGNTIPDPVETCLRQMRPFHLDSDAILLGRTGERRHVRDSAAPVRTAAGEIVGAVLVFQDVTKARTLQQALEHSASHDSLTGLPNRAAFERELREANRQPGREHTLCFIDLDRFKIVNDDAGHAAGDALLREVANLLRRGCRSQDLAARLGGDEFALLLRDCAIGDGERIATQLLRDIGRLQFAWNEVSYRIGASIGLTIVGREALRSDELMDQADIACYRAKAAGRNQIAIYGDDDALTQQHRETRIATSIRNAIEAGRFQLFAQQALDLRAGRRVRHFEILLRMLDDEGGIVEPAVFIPASERYDLMGTLDRWVVRTTLRNYGPRLCAIEDLSIAINLSGNSISDPFFWPFLQEELAASGLAPERLHLEIADATIINNLSAARRFVPSVRAAGCRVILDDFGTGTSPFTYLRQFRVDGLKIDGRLISEMTGSEIDRAIVESINTIGHRLGAITIAEQVEDEATLALVRAMGIDQAQGFAIARPERLDNLL